MARRTTVAIKTQNGNETQAQRLSIFAEAQTNGTIVYTIEALGYEEFATLRKYESMGEAIKCFSEIANVFLKRQRFKLLDEDDD